MKLDLLMCESAQVARTFLRFPGRIYSKKSLQRGVMEIVPQKDFYWAESWAVFYTLENSAFRFAPFEPAG